MLNDNQWRAIRSALASAFGSWLFSQIADSSIGERMWNQIAILALGAGALRVWLLEAEKPERSNGHRPQS